MLSFTLCCTNFLLSLKALRGGILEPAGGTSQICLANLFCSLEMGASEEFPVLVVWEELDAMILAGVLGKREKEEEEDLYTSEKMKKQYKAAPMSTIA